MDNSLPDQYLRRTITTIYQVVVAPPAWFEHATYGLGNRCSIQLSYGSGDGAKSGVKLGAFARAV